jgi:hypothetical protein
MNVFTAGIKFACFCVILIIPPAALAQAVGSNGTNANGSNSTAVPTAVSFLNITPDARSGAMGDAGVAIPADVNAAFWNPAKLAFLDENDNVSVAYSPWLRQLIPDISLSYLSYAHKTDENTTIGASLRYFNLGTIQLADENQNNLGTYKPNEFAVDGSFSRKFGDNFALGFTLRYIHSSLANGFVANGEQVKAGNAVAADVSLYYSKPTQEFGTDAVFAFGVNISNIGSKISYTDNQPGQFLPTNLKVGIANTWYPNDANQFTFALDLNKLLVPSPLRDANGNIIDSRTGLSVPAGIFQSFSDAPGGFSGELKQISLSPGVEYWYNKLFALRAGYYYESASNGGRHYLTVGTGLKYDVFKFDFSYIAASQQNSPLANTLRVTLSANFGNTK